MRDRIAAWNTALSPLRTSPEKPRGDAPAADPPDAPEDLISSMMMQEDHAATNDVSDERPTAGQACFSIILTKLDRLRAAQSSSNQMLAMIPLHESALLEQDLLMTVVTLHLTLTLPHVLRPSNSCPVVEQEVPASVRPEASLGDWRQLPSKPSPEPSRDTRRDSAGRERRMESPKIAALKAAIAASAFSRFAEPPHVGEATMQPLPSCMRSMAGTSPSCSPSGIALHDLGLELVSIWSHVA